MICNMAQTTGSNPDSLVEEMTEYFREYGKETGSRHHHEQETWQNISEEGKSIWDKLNNSDKQEILQYAMK